MEALSPRDVNAQRTPRVQELKAKMQAQVKATKEKDHPPPPPNYVTEPASEDRREGAVYKIGRFLGKGGFAICHEGTLAGTTKRYALKIVKSKMQAKMEQKFQTELQIHSKMRHQNIVQFHRAFTFESCTYLILELCPNGSLIDMVKRRKGLTEPEVRFYTVQIAGAIKYMHAKGIIHRDLKMGNIFLDRHMNAKIGDFGLAALLLTGKDMQIMRRTTLCGTPNYIAPEILEKGKKGHDHMVDIWSLGIIVFAMLTSKPPFQSTTTDEIYRRAKERDYEWPSPENSLKYISPEAKDLVAIMLQEAEMRPDSDMIVEHPFFTSGYMPTAEDINFKLREFPPENPSFYGTSNSPHASALNLRYLQEMCRQCGVGPWNKSQLIFKKIWREMADEESHGLTPAIPLAEGIVYRPYDEVRSEQKLQNRLALQQAQLNAQFKAECAERERNQELSSPSQSVAPHAKPLTGLRAPPQSFAAQQRAQGRPTANAGMPRSQPILETTSKGTGSGRGRIKREATTAELPHSIEDRSSSTAGQRQREGSLAPVSNSRATASIGEPSLSAKSERSIPMRQKTVKHDRFSMFSPSEMLSEVSGTRPDQVLGRLRKLQTELERALNARSMAILSSRHRTPGPPHIVVKWVDYTNKFGLGYILNDGSVGCILRNGPASDGTRSDASPSSCVLVHGAERHCMRRDDETYADRAQILPMTEKVYFYENIGESGLRLGEVSPETFRTIQNADGSWGKLGPGKDVYEHRKREKIVVWKKFANYMITYGHGLDDPDMEETFPVAPVTDMKNGPSDVVTFYQRFGDVGCWVFCDGHAQFNFPDHTKIVLDAAGTWCHFWHLPQEAAKQLKETGSLPPTALDERTVLSYPLQTLLNFSTVARSSRSQNAASMRRRPEIRPELQGIPAANWFRRKIEFILGAVREWTANGGLGNSDMSREGRLRWTGPRETVGVPLPAKHIWVTIGARQGDKRLAAYVDPRRPEELGDEIDETRRPHGTSRRTGPAAVP